MEHSFIIGGAFVDGKPTEPKSAAEVERISLIVDRSSVERDPLTNKLALVAGCEAEAALLEKAKLYHWPERVTVKVASNGTVFASIRKAVKSLSSDNLDTLMLSGR